MVMRNWFPGRSAWHRDRPTHPIGKHAPTGLRTARAKPSQGESTFALSWISILQVFVPYFSVGECRPETKLDRVLRWLAYAVYALIPVIVFGSIYFFEGLFGARWGALIPLGFIFALSWWSDRRAERSTSADDTESPKSTAYGSGLGSLSSSAQGCPAAVGQQQGG